jgi:DNA-binding LacI/PurR family transcriptional regulator
MPQRKSGHVTLSDVARASGFSVSTVSIVLSEAPLSEKVKALTREKVRAAALKLGYHPDAHARSLRRRSTQTIAVLAFDLSDPYSVPVLRGVQLALQESEYLPLVLDAQGERDLFDAHLQLLLERRAEGLIVLASWVFEEANLLADVRKNKVPIVIVGRDFSRRGISSVLVDNKAGGALAMEHLIGLGHTSVAVMRGPEQMSDSAPRWLGVQRMAAQHELTLDPSLVVQLPGAAHPTSSGFEGGREMVGRLLKGRRKFTAVLAFDDLTALGAMRALSEAGMAVPGACSIIGFDDVLPARLCTPAMSTIRQPLKQMGREAAGLILAAVQSGDTRAARDGCRLVKAKPELVARHSTAPPVRTR